MTESKFAQNVNFGGNGYNIVEEAMEENCGFLIDSQVFLYTLYNWSREVRSLTLFTM